MKLVTKISFYLLNIFFIILANQISIAQWVQTNGPGGGVVYTFAVSDTNLFAGTYGSGVFLSTNNGTSWTEASSGLTYTNVLSLAVNGTNLFAGTYGGGIFISTNNGLSWTAKGLTNIDIWTLAVNGMNLFAGTDGSGVFLSTNNGTNWTEVNYGLINKYVRTLTISNSNLFAGTYGSGVFLLTNNDTSWTEVNTGLGITEISSLIVSDTNLFAGSYSGNVWRRPLSEMITSVEGSSIDLPIGFVLSQNYPNPFNPSTKIKYSVPHSSKIVIKVYDILGNEIKTLVNKEKARGTYEITWYAKGLPSGVYFYQLKSDNYIETKKMLLLK